MATKIQVVFDCADPDAQAAFWAAALGYIVQPPPEGFADWPAFLTAHGMADRLGTASAIVDPDGAGPRVFFQRVPEGKVVKNRVHLDISVTGGPRTPLDERRTRVAAEVTRLSGLGARKIREYLEYGEFWIVMADPEDNEFCLH